MDTALAPGGFTGLSLTPNAHLLQWGQSGFAYDRQIPGARDPAGHNFVLGFGLLPNLEISGRLASNLLSANCFREACGSIRDLSASAKASIGLDTANRFRLAAGITDVGGAATFFRSYYGVLTYSEGSLEASGGIARRGGGALASSPLDGPFASAAWQPLPWLRGHVEYTDGNAWAGVRLFAPQQWLPEGWSAHVGATARLTDSGVTDRSWWSAGLTIPLYKVPALPGPRSPLPSLAGTQQPLPAYEARVPAPRPEAPAPAATPIVPAAPGVPAPAVTPTEPVTDEALQQLAQSLHAAGLEDVSVGRMPDGSVAIRANNATYNWNSVDALGAALGATARALGGSRRLYRLVLTQRQVPLVAVTGQTDCLRQWITQPASTCPGGELSTPGTLLLDALHDGASWVVRGARPSWKTLRVQLTPVLRTHVGTEVGAFDYSAGVNIGLLQPLWPGASAEWRVQQEVARSSDFGPDGVFARQRVPSGTERLVLTQTLQLRLPRLPGTAVAQGTVGRIGSHYDGAHGAMRWEPREGRHRFTAQAGWFRNSKPAAFPGEPLHAKPLLLEYRYNVAATRTYLEATGGQFMFNDRGLQIGLRQWFSDVAVQVYLRRTHPRTGPARTMAGLELSLPIGPRRDMNPSGVQLTGTPRFRHAIETVVGGGANVVVSGLGVLPPAPSLDALFNSDRASLLYFEDNVRRVRDAAR